MVGSILDGPESRILQPLVSQALPVIIEMMGDASVHVKDTAAWTLGRISEYHPDCIKPDLYLHSLVGALLRGLEDTPRVAVNCAWVGVIGCYRCSHGLILHPTSSYQLPNNRWISSITVGNY